MLEFSNILIYISAGFLFVIIIGFIAPLSRGRELLVERLMLIFHGVFSFCREQIQRAVQIIQGWMHRITTSIGVSGEHSIQRIVGILLLSTFTIVVFAVDFLLADRTLAGYFGSGEEQLMSGLSLDMISGASVVASLFIWGSLLLDTLKITHITIFSSDKIKPWFNIALRILSIIGLLLAISLLVGLAWMRIEGIEANALIDDESISENSEILVYTEESQTEIPNILNDIGQSNSDYENKPMKTSFAVKYVQIGMVVASGLAGAFSAIAFIGASALILSFPLYLVVMIFSGLILIITTIGMRIIDLVYGFLVTIINFFLEIGENLRNRFNIQPLVSESTNNLDNPMIPAPTNPSTPAPTNDSSSDLIPNAEEIQPDSEEPGNNPQVQNNNVVEDIDFSPIFNPLSGS